MKVTYLLKEAEIRRAIAEYLANTETGSGIEIASAVEFRFFADAGEWTATVVLEEQVPVYPTEKP